MWALEAVVAAVLLVLGLGDGRRLKAMRAEVRVRDGRDAIMAPRHPTVTAEVKFCERRQLGARTRVENPLLVVERERHVLYPTAGRTDKVRLTRPAL